jgi:hypothetical protein
MVKRKIVTSSVDNGSKKKKTEPDLAERAMSRETVDLSKICAKCLELKPVEAFGKNGVWLQSYCKPCGKKYKNLRGNTHDGFIQNLLSNSKGSSKRRSNDGTADTHQLTVHEFEELLEENNYCCYYSHMPLNFQRYSNWQCSIERLINTQDYLKQHCVPVALESNTRAQWSVEKADFVTSYSTCSDTEDDESRLERLLEEGKVESRAGVKHKKQGREVINGVLISAKCNKCNIWKPAEAFHSAKVSNCKACKSEYNALYRQTLQGKLKVMLLDAKSSSKKRQKNARREDMGKFTLTYDQTLKLFIQQKGRCYISNVPMNVHGESWVMSIERIDVRLNYSENNCCIICQEFNTSDWSAMIEEGREVDGCAGWTREKFSLFKEQYLQYKENGV